MEVEHVIIFKKKKTKRITIIITLITFFMFFNFAGTIMVHTNPIIFPSGESDSIENEIINEESRDFTQKFYIEIISIMYAESFNDTGDKLLISNGKLDCLINFNKPKANSTLFVFLNFFLDSYKFDTLFRSYIIKGMKLENIS